MIHLQRKIIVAIDGYSSCGKSSYAKLIAKNIDYLYLDSGAMYRAVALYALRNEFIREGKVDKSKIIDNLSAIHISFNNSGEEPVTELNGENIEREIRGVEVSSVVSKISSIPEIRHRLVQLQQEMGKEKGIVMDGRDIGTVVFPEAECKIFMEADVNVRAMRRYNELIDKGMSVSLAEITKNIEDRDYQDINRKVSPLVKASDAITLDNSHMTLVEQLYWFFAVLTQKGLLDQQANGNNN